jgi:hypothetical protein
MNLGTSWPHGPAALPPPATRKKPPVSIDQEAQWAPEPVWTV